MTRNGHSHSSSARRSLARTARAKPPRFAVGTARQIVLDPSELSPWTIACTGRSTPVSELPEPAFLVGSDARIAAANAPAQELLGTGRDELLGARFDRFVEVGNVPAAERRDAPSFRYVGRTSGACARHRSGRIIPVQMTICPHGDEATIVILHVQQAIRAELEEERLAHVVHDLKNPLSTIALEADVLDAALPASRGGDVDAALRRIRDNVAFLDRMVHELLDVSSIDAGRFALVRRAIDMAELVEDVVARVIPSRDAHRVSLTCEGHWVVDVDELRIQRVVINLIENALKYAPSNTPVAVRVSACESGVRVEVADRGPGIDADDAPYVFDKYRRLADGSQHSGHGLGLFVSKEIVTAHGGRIGVDSVRGTGSCFFFELPVS